MPDEVILEVRHLRTSFLQGGSEMRAVDDMSYTVKRASVLPSSANPALESRSVPCRCCA